MTGALKPRPAHTAAGARARPRLGFLGTGWIGRDRLGHVLRSGSAEVRAIADPAPDCLAAALELAPAAAAAAGLEELLEAGVDGIVIATPSALHARQAIEALEAGVAVFAQKPLGRDAAEVRAVLAAARRADTLLGVDLCYRSTAAAEAVRARVQAGTLGPVHAVDLVFHNAYGPDKPWFTQPEQSGGGCLIDLGIHLVDLLLWTLGFPEVDGVRGRLWREGRAPGPAETEDLCLAEIDLAGGTRARLACSWFSHEGRDAVIEATFRGRDAAAGLHNVSGSFYDLAAELRRGTSSDPLARPPDAWPGRTIVDWARRLGEGERFDPACERLVDVAEVLDSIYRR